MANLSDRAGAPTFNALIDTPSSFSGQAGLVATVNPGEDAIIFAAAAAGGLEIVEIDLSVTPSPTMENGKIYLVKPDESTPGNNTMTLPTGAPDVKLVVIDINFKFETFPVNVIGTIDGGTNLNLDTNHCWGNFYYHVGDTEWKSAISYDKDALGLNRTVVAIGLDSGTTNQGTQSIAIGNEAGETNQGVGAIAIGQNAGQTTQGAGSLAIGSNAGLTNQGAASFAIGANAGQINQLDNSLAIGASAGTTNQADRCLAIGFQAGNLDQGQTGLAIGYNAGRNRQGERGLAIGRESGENDQGTRATGIGYRCGRTNQGDYSIAIGVFAGETDQPSRSICINSDSTGTNPSSTKQIVIGRSDYDVKIGDGNVSSVSDARDKYDVQDIPLGLDFVNALQPKFYKYDIRELYEETDEEGNVIKHAPDRSKAGARFHSGFIAQDVHETMNDFGVDFGVYRDQEIKAEEAHRERAKDKLSLCYQEFIAVQTKAIQELSAKVDLLEAEITELKS